MGAPTLSKSKYATLGDASGSSTVMERDGDKALNSHGQFIQQKRLREQIGDAKFQGQKGMSVMDPTYYEHRSLSEARFLFKATQSLQPIRHWHQVIQYDEGRPEIAGDFERGAPIARSDDSITVHFETMLHQYEHKRLVISHEHQRRLL